MKDLIALDMIGKPFIVSFIFTRDHKFIAAKLVSMISIHIY